MNRRSFMSKVLGALAIVPLIGKLAKGKSIPPVYKGPLKYTEQKFVFGNPYSYVAGGGYFNGAAIRRDKLLNYLRSQPYVETTAEAVSRMFADFDYDQIDAFCEEHGLLIEARLTGVIRISKPWQIHIVNEFAAL